MPTYHHDQQGALGSISVEDMPFLFQVCSLNMKRIVMVPELAHAAGQLALIIRDDGGMLHTSGNTFRWQGMRLDRAGRQFLEAVVRGVVAQPKGLKRDEVLRLIGIGRKAGVPVPSTAGSEMLADDIAPLRDGLIGLKRWFNS